MFKIHFWYSLLSCIIYLSYIDSSTIQEDFAKHGYTLQENPCDSNATFERLYAAFDELISFLQTNAPSRHALYRAKEQFIRSREKEIYSTDFFGFYDESSTPQRGQVAFYYSLHFHKFIQCRYPTLYQAAPICHFMELCFQMQQPLGDFFHKVAHLLDEPKLFSPCLSPPILFKLVKYLSSYTAKMPHYDGTAFSLFLHSTDPTALRLSPYRTSFSIEDFTSPYTQEETKSDISTVVLIPGSLLTEFSIYPTPHIVLQNGTTRYATIAFAMRPYHTSRKIPFSTLPLFKS